MRYLSWLLSGILHAVLLAVLIHSVQLHPMFEPKLLELDLTEIEAEPEVAELTVPKPPPPPPEPVPEPVPEPEPTPAVVAPLPMDKTVVLDEPPPLPPSAPEPVAELETTPAPAPPPDAVAIKDEAAEEEPEPDLSNVGTDLDKANVRREHLTVHRGHEARFGRMLLADYYAYSSAEFSGQFTTRDNRTISIIDARDTEYGRFLIYDSKNKTLRRMKAFNKYVYTIGPSAYADEPVTGTVTFLAKDDRIERFILTTDDDRSAHYPRKIHVREADTTFPSDGVDIPCTTTLPPEGEQHTGLVFVPGTQCGNTGLIRGFTRSLSARKLASLFFLPRGCGDEEPVPSPPDEIRADTAAALTSFSARPQVRRAGLWGNGPGAPVAIRTALRPDASPAFVVCLLNDDVSPGDMPDASSLRPLDVPVLWLVTGHHTRDWVPYIKTLEKLRDTKGKRFTIIVAPSKASKEVEAAHGDESALVEQVVGDHAGLAASWIQALDAE